MNVLVTLLVCSLAAAVQVEVRPLSGQSATGSLKAIDGEHVLLDTASGEQTLATKDLLGISLRTQPSRTEARPQVWLDLVDGARLVGLEYNARQERATLKLVDARDVELRPQMVSAVRLKEQNEKIARQWADIVAAPRSNDVIVVRREASVDFLDGVVGDVSAESVQFTVDGDLINVRRQRVEGFLYFHPRQAELPEAVCQVTCHDGSRLSATKVVLAEEGLSLFTPSGAQIVRPLEAVKEIDYSLGKLRYLSDLEWESLQRQDFLSAANIKPDSFFDPRKDSSFLGPLRLGNKTYAKGLALKSYTKLVYLLPGKFSRFVAEAGIDPQVVHGHVTLKISGDQQVLFESAIAGGDAPQSLSLDIKGVRRLTIEVGFGNGGDAGDHLNLGDARIIQ